ncbi:MAG: fumarylacetoacetate hydrolase family protein, partial [Acidimicrobiaceae bacterium]|nr:fumarylacetoacetate hydrolase family protein [Acidimicrobiaceae bacterium]
SGPGGRRIPIERARSHIAGVTLGNEGTIRDWIRHGRFNVTQGKNWHRSGSIGPWLVTLDEIGDLDDLHLTTRVNGELRQDDLAGNMRFSIEYQIHYLSTFVGLDPGDVVFTGTPTGAGARFDPPIWLQPRDVVGGTAPASGTPRNTIRDEQAR